MGSEFIQVNKLTSLEAIVKGNATNRVLVSNSRFNRMPINETYHTGTGFAYEAKDKPFGKNIEKGFPYDGKSKVLIYPVRKEDIGARNIMHLFEHQFRQDSEGTIQLINAKTGKQILSVDELHEAGEILLRVEGGIRNFKLTGRKEIEFGAEGAKIFVEETSAIGLLRRGDGFIYSKDKAVTVDYSGLEDRFHVLFEKNGADLLQEAEKAQK